MQRKYEIGARTGRAQKKELRDANERDNEMGNAREIERKKVTTDKSSTGNSPRVVTQQDDISEIISREVQSGEDEETTA